MRLMSLIPVSAMFRVLGMGVAVRVNTSQVSASCFSCSFWGHTEPVFLVDYKQPKVVKFHIFAEQPMSSNQDVN